MRTQVLRRMLFVVMMMGAVLFRFSTVQAQTTNTWTQSADGSQDWNTAGNWDGSGVFVSGDGNNELTFFADTTTTLPAGHVQTITGVPAALSMNTLTLNGRGPNDPAGFTINIGDSSSTWTIGDGTTSTVNLNSTRGGGGVERSVRYTVLPNITLNHTTTTFTGNGENFGYIFSGNITEAEAGYGVTKSGSSHLVLSGVNSYTGPTLLSGGVLRLLNEDSLPGGMGVTGGTSALTINSGGILELSGVSLLRNLGTGSDQFRITGGNSGFSAMGAPGFVAVNGDAATELVWGSTHFAPSTLVFNHSITGRSPSDSAIWLANNLDLNGANRTIQVSADVAVLSGDIRSASGTANLTKSGGGTLVLSGNNTYNGNTTISGGTLSIGAASNLGSGDLILNAATLQIRGTALTSLDSGLGRTVTINTGGKGFDIQDANNIFTVDKVLNQGSGTLTKSGVGTLVLNQDNTFTGATTVTGGGTLVLDYTTNNGSKLADGAALNLRGGRLVLKGGSHTEVVGSTLLSSNNGPSWGNSISRDGGTSKINLGAINFYNTLSTLSIAEENLAMTSTANASEGILSLGRITVGPHFAANDGSGNIVAYGDYTAATTAGGGGVAVVNQLEGGGTMAANLTSYALRIVNDDNSNVLELNDSALLLRNNSAFLYAGGFDNNYTINGPGVLSSGSGNQPFVINTFAGTTLTINSRITSSFTTIQKAGEGTLVLGGNTQFGDSNPQPLGVQQGVLRLAHKDALGSARSTEVQGGAALELSGGIDFAAQPPLVLDGAGISNGGALRNVSGDNTWGGAITTGASGARINADSGTSLTLTAGITTRGGQPLAFGGAGDITVGGTPAINGAANLLKDGAGTLELVVTDSSVSSTCGDMALNAGKLGITFEVAPSESVPVLKVLGDLTFTGTPTINVTLDKALVTTGEEYPLLTVYGSAPTTVPTLEGFAGSLKWGGPDNKTLYLNTGARGTVLIFM